MATEETVVSGENRYKSKLYSLFSSRIFTQFSPSTGREAGSLNDHAAIEDEAMNKSLTTFREDSIGQPIEKNYAAAGMIEEKEWYRELLEGAFDAAFIFSMNGHMSDINPAACLLTGYSREELLSLEFDDLKARSNDGEGNMLKRDGNALAGDRARLHGKRARRRRVAEAFPRGGTKSRVGGHH